MKQMSHSAGDNIILLDVGAFRPTRSQFHLCPKLLWALSISPELSRRDVLPTYVGWKPHPFCTYVIERTRLVFLGMSLPHSRPRRCPLFLLSSTPTIADVHLTRGSCGISAHICQICLSNCSWEQGNNYTVVLRTYVKILNPFLHFSETLRT